MAEITKEVKKPATPNVKPAMALVSAEEKGKEWTYSEIVKVILEKKQQRSMCAACTDSLEMGNVHPDCIFYEHKKSLANNKDQGARLACYKDWTLLVHGTIGVRRQRPISICMEAKIKLLKPSSKFKGFEENKEKNDSSSDEDTWEGMEKQRVK